MAPRRDDRAGGGIVPAPPARAEVGFWSAAAYDLATAPAQFLRMAWDGLSGFGSYLGGRGYSKQPRDNTGTHLPGSGRDWREEAGDLWLNSTVAVGIQTFGREFIKAKFQVLETRPADDAIGNDEDGTQDVPIPDHPLPALIRKPNNFYPGRVLWWATLLSYLCDGNAYWMKLYDLEGRLRELWWIPHWSLEPIWAADGTQYISHYQYNLNGKQVPVPSRNVVHFRNGLDPADSRMGMSPLKAILRSVCSVNEADTYLYALMRNLGIPSLVVAPKGELTDIDQADADGIKAEFQSDFTGDNRFKISVLNAPMDIQSHAFSPESMVIDKVRGIPEMTICAAIGGDPLAFGLPSGRANSSYKSMPEARAGLWRTIISIQDAFAEDLDEMVLPDLSAPSGRADWQRLLKPETIAILASRGLMGDPPPSRKCGWDRRNVDALREDLESKANRAAMLWKNDQATLGVASDIIGVTATPELAGLRFSELQFLIQQGQTPAIRDLQAQLGIDPDAAPGGEEDEGPDDGPAFDPDSLGDEDFTRAAMKSIQDAATGPDGEEPTEDELTLLALHRLGVFTGDLPEAPEGDLPPEAEGEGDGFPPEGRKSIEEGIKAELGGARQTTPTPSTRQRGKGGRSPRTFASTGGPVGRRDYRRGPDGKFAGSRPGPNSGVSDPAKAPASAATAGAGKGRRDFRRGPDGKFRGSNGGGAKPAGPGGPAKGPDAATPQHPQVRIDVRDDGRPIPPKRSVPVAIARDWIRDHVVEPLSRTRVGGYARAGADAARATVDTAREVAAAAAESMRYTYGIPIQAGMQLVHRAREAVRQAVAEFGAAWGQVKQRAKEMRRDRNLTASSRMLGRKYPGRAVKIWPGSRFVGKHADAPVGIAPSGAIVLNADHPHWENPRESSARAFAAGKQSSASPFHEVHRAVARRDLGPGRKRLEGAPLPDSLIVAARNSLGTRAIENRLEFVLEARAAIRAGRKLPREIAEAAKQWAREAGSAGKDKAAATTKGPRKHIILPGDPGFAAPGQPRPLAGP